MVFINNLLVKTIFGTTELCKLLNESNIRITLMGKDLYTFLNRIRIEDEDEHDNAQMPELVIAYTATKLMSVDEAPMYDGVVWAKGLVKGLVAGSKEVTIKSMTCVDEEAEVHGLHVEHLNLTMICTNTVDDNVYNPMQMPLLKLMSEVSIERLVDCTIPGWPRLPYINVHKEPLEIRLAGTKESIDTHPQSGPNMMAAAFGIKLEHTRTNVDGTTSEYKGRVFDASIPV